MRHVNAKYNAEIYKNMRTAYCINYTFFVFHFSKKNMLKEKVHLDTHALII